MKRLPDLPLTEEQQALIAPHARLATWAVNRFLRRSGLTPIEFEEAEGWCTMALVRAAQLYDGRVQFATYAWRWLHSACLHFGRKRDSDHSRAKFVKVNLEDDTVLFPDDTDHTRPIELRDEIRSIRRKLTRREWRVLTLRYLRGLYAQEVADRIGMTKNGVYMVEKRAIAKLRKKEQQCES